MQIARTLLTGMFLDCIKLDDVWEIATAWFIVLDERLVILSSLGRIISTIGIGGIEVR